MMTTEVWVAGVDVAQFYKPGQSPSYAQMSQQAILGALHDAGIQPEDIQQAFAGYVYGDSTCGQHALYSVLQTGIPIVNVNNNCSTGSTALYLARQAILSGSADCVLAVGFEQMQPGALTSHWQDRESPFDPFMHTLDTFGFAPAPLALRCFGAAGEHYMQRYDVGPNLFAKVAVKTRRHAGNNPKALFTAALTEQEVLDAPLMYGDYLTRLMCCPPTCGAGAAVLVSDRFAKRHGISAQCVALRAQAMATDTATTWQDPVNLVGTDMTARAARAVQEASGINISDVDVVELHDCFTVNEVLSYEALGLCQEGAAEKLIADGNNSFGGDFVVNPSGGLMSKGHPLGATGLAQCYELVQQLRGNAEARQVPQARLGLQHNLGLGGAVVVTLYERLS